MSDLDDGLSEQRCPICQCLVPVSTIVLVPGLGQICEDCDEELLDQARATSHDCDEDCRCCATCYQTNGIEVCDQLCPHACVSEVSR